MAKPKVKCFLPLASQGVWVMMQAHHQWGSMPARLCLAGCLAVFTTLTHCPSNTPLVQIRHTPLCLGMSTMD